MKPAKIALLVVAWFAIVSGLLAGWIALVYVANVRFRIAITAEEALNLVLVVFIGLIGLPIFHAASYRWFWHMRRKQAAGQWRLGDAQPAFGSEPTLPPPKVRRSVGQIAVYIVLYVVAMASLIGAHAPLGHQEALNAFLGRFSSGSASFSSLVTLVIIYLPMAAGFACLAPFISADHKRIADGGLTESELLRLTDRQEWLFSFFPAYVVAGYLSYFAGNMILSHLG